MIIRTRRRLINAAKALREQGVESPPGDDRSCTACAPAVWSFPATSTGSRPRQLAAVDREIEEAEALQGAAT